MTEHEVAVALEQRLHAVCELVGVETGVEGVAAHLGAAQPGREEGQGQAVRGGEADGIGGRLADETGLVSALVEAPQHVLGNGPESLA